jgi:peptidoglycan/xylan/chitin deacetylase (PgdA/CDA1 family)
MYMKMKDGKSKVITFSYDDGVVQDIRLIDIFNKYGLKGTFNINTGLYLPEDAERERYYGRMKLSEAQELYIGSGHEVAVHALTHPFLEQLKDDEVLDEILSDRKNIENQYKTIARGMAYPFGTYNDTVVDVLRECGVKYSRTVRPTYSFDMQTDLLRFHPTCHHNDERLFELADEFLNAEPTKPMLFCVWGHTYEFDGDKNWDMIERFCEYVAGREDIYYCTNAEALL